MKMEGGEDSPRSVKVEEEEEGEEGAALRAALAESEREAAELRAALAESERTAAEERERRELQARNQRDIWLFRGYQAAARAGKGHKGKGKWK